MNAIEYEQVRLEFDYLNLPAFEQLMNAERYRLLKLDRERLVAARTAVLLARRPDQYDRVRYRLDKVVSPIFRHRTLGLE